MSQRCVELEPRRWGGWRSRSPWCAGLLVMVWLVGASRVGSAAQPLVAEAVVVGHQAKLKPRNLRVARVRPDIARVEFVLPGGSVEGVKEDRWVGFVQGTGVQRRGGAKGAFRWLDSGGESTPGGGLAGLSWSVASNGQLTVRSARAGRGSELGYRLSQAYALKATRGGMREGKGSWVAVVEKVKGGATGLGGIESLLSTGTGERLKWGPFKDHWWRQVADWVELFPRGPDQRQSSLAEAADWLEAQGWEIQRGAVSACPKPGDPIREALVSFPGLPGDTVDGRLWMGRGDSIVVKASHDGLNLVGAGTDLDDLAAAQSFAARMTIGLSHGLAEQLGYRVGRMGFRTALFNSAGQLVFGPWTGDL